MSRFVDPGLAAVGGISHDIFIGSGAELGVPVSPSRVLILAGGVAVIARRSRGATRPIRPQPLHVLLVVYVARLGLLVGHAAPARARPRAARPPPASIPFWLLFLAPLAFATEHSGGWPARHARGARRLPGRDGAVRRTLKLYAFVSPKYVLDPAYGSHRDRAGLVTWKHSLTEWAVRLRRRRRDGHRRLGANRPRVATPAARYSGCAPPGAFFTLTREVWLGPRSRPGGDRRDYADCGDSCWRRSPWARR